MYLEGGHLYVFFVYGMHYCANIVTRATGVPEAVLLRAAEGPPGAPPKLMSGPGRLCAALGITAGMSGADLRAAGDLRLFARRRRRSRAIGVSPRIGVDYSGAAKEWPLRFFLLESAAVSGPARLRCEPAGASRRQRGDA
jgi:DNA-3-methyladenine glycosylase